MKIEWNKVTPFSRLCAIIIFFVVIPMITFYFGIEYEKVNKLQMQSEKIITMLSDDANNKSVTHIFKKEDRTASLVVDRYHDRINFSGEAFYTHDNKMTNAEDQQKLLIMNKLVGTADLIGNRAVYSMNTNCKIIFVYINKNTLTINVENPSVCGWGNNVNFAGVYTLDS